MTNRKNGGFTILLVLWFIALFAAALLTLAGSTNSLAVDSSNCQADAYRRNLQASSAAWLRHNLTAPTTQSQNLSDGIILDVSALHMPEATLRLAKPADASKGNRYQMDIQFRAGRLMVKSSQEITIEGKPQP
jgi:hypothetical protein